MHVNAGRLALVASGALACLLGGLLAGEATGGSRDGHLFRVDTVTTTIRGQVLPAQTVTATVPQVVTSVETVTAAQHVVEVADTRRRAPSGPKRSPRKAHPAAPKPPAQPAPKPKPAPKPPKPKPPPPPPPPKPKPAPPPPPAP